MTVTVVKLGGHALDATTNAGLLLDALATDLLEMQRDGDVAVLVHGGGPQINELVASLGIETSFVDGLRVTTAEVLRCVVMGLSHVNVQLVAELQRRGVPAVGVHGASNNLLVCAERSNTLGAVGLLPTADSQLLDTLVDSGFVPVVAPFAVDTNGQVVNCNADSAAGAVAAALHADTLLLLSDIDHVRLDPDDASTAVSRLTVALAGEMLSSGAAADGMRPKIESALAAIASGAGRVLIGNGSVPHSVRDVLSHTAPSTEVVA